MDTNVPMIETLTQQLITEYYDVLDNVQLAAMTSGVAASNIVLTESRLEVHDHSAQLVGYIGFKEQKE